MKGSPIEDPDHETTHRFSNPGATEAVGQKPLFIDGHVDLPYFMMNHGEASSLASLDDGPFTLEKARKAGFRVFSTALYCEDTFNGARSFQHFQNILHFTTDHFDQVTIIKNRGDLRGVQESTERIGTLFLLENADALTGNLSYVSQLKEQGIWIVGLTHAGKNRLGDGNAVVDSDGLTTEGRAVIRALTLNGLLIDVAHLHPRCFWQLLDVTEATIISSHTGVRELCDIPRNIDLMQAREIFERGGTVGITFDPEMLSPERSPSIDDVFAHLDTLVQEFGPNGVGIGSDYCGFERITKGLEDITGIGNLIGKMRANGYGEDAVNRIMGFNWLRVYRQFL